MVNPVVSIIIPSYNHGRFLRETISSCVKGALPLIELIVIDDGSTDHSWDLLQELATTNSRLRIFRQENQGAHATINRGLALAKGEFLAILNSDDRYAPGRIAQLLTLAQAEDLDFIATGLRLIDAAGRPITEEPWLEEYQRMVRRAQRDGLWLALLERNITVSTSNFFMRRRLYEQLGPLQPYKYNMDWDYALRAYLAAPKRFAWRPELCLWEYRWHGSNTILDALPLAAIEANHLLQNALQQHYGLPAAAFSGLRRHHRLIRQQQVAAAVAAQPSCGQRLKNKLQRLLGFAPKAKRAPAPATTTVTAAPPSIAVHIHLYYVDLLDELISAVEQLPGTPAVFISTPHELAPIQAALQVRLPLATLWHCPNQGKDLGPFIDAINRFGLAQYDVVLKLHSKKSLNAPSYMAVMRQLFGADLRDGEHWRQALIAPIAGSPAAAQQALGLFTAAGSKVGMVGAKRFLCHAPDANAAAYAQLCARLGMPAERPTFFAGTMFWIRGSLLQAFSRAGFSLEDFSPASASAVENSLEHQMERVFGALVAKYGYAVHGL